MNSPASRSGSPAALHVPIHASPATIPTPIYNSPLKPSVTLSHASSSSASSSSAASPSPRRAARPPPPPARPSQFLFWPDPLPTPPHPSRQLFAYGWTKGTTTLVAGVLEADDRQAAEVGLAEVGAQLAGRRATDGLRIVGCCQRPAGVGLGIHSLGKGKTRAEACAEEDVGEDWEGEAFPRWLQFELPVDGAPVVLVQPAAPALKTASATTARGKSSRPLTNGLSGSPLPAPTSPPSLNSTPRRPRPTSPPVTIITYTPPSRAQLQFFSLTPLQLDLTSFSSGRQHRTRRRPSVSAPGSAANVAEQATKREEGKRAALVAKLRRSVRLDFSSATDGGSLPGGVADLERVVDWVSGGIVPLGRWPRWRPRTQRSSADFPCFRLCRSTSALSSPPTSRPRPRGRPCGGYRSRPRSPKPARSSPIQPGSSAPSARAFSSSPTTSCQAWAAPP